MQTFNKYNALNMSAIWRIIPLKSKLYYDEKNICFTDYFCSIGIML